MIASVILTQMIQKVIVSPFFCRVHEGSRKYTPVLKGAGSQSVVAVSVCQHTVAGQHQQANMHNFFSCFNVAKINRITQTNTYTDVGPQTHTHTHKNTQTHTLTHTHTPTPCTQSSLQVSATLSSLYQVLHTHTQIHESRAQCSCRSLEHTH